MPFSEFFHEAKDNWRCLAQFFQTHGMCWIRKTWQLLVGKDGWNMMTNLVLDNGQFVGPKLCSRFKYLNNFWDWKILEFDSQYGHSLPKNMALAFCSELSLIFTWINSENRETWNESWNVCLFSMLFTCLHLSDLHFYTTSWLNTVKTNFFATPCFCSELASLFKVDKLLPFFSVEQNLTCQSSN